MMRYAFVALIYFVATIMIGVSGALAESVAVKVGRKEAQHLAGRAVWNNARADVRYLDFQPGMAEPFITFQGVSPRSTFGYYAVNPWTGDVWALGSCHKMTTPALSKAQEAIHRRFTAEEDRDYARLRDIKPWCISGD